MPKPARKTPRTASKPPKAPSERRPPTKRKAPARRKAPSRTDARKFAAAAARSLEDDKCQEVLVLDLEGRSQVTDYFVIASGSSDRQMHSAAEHVIELAEGLGHSLYRSNIDETRPNWIILDFVDVIIHVMMPEARTYYDLEMLWGDAPRINASRKRPGAAAADSKRNRAGLNAADLAEARRGSGRSA